MSSLNIGLSAMNVNQHLLDLTGQNIANANTPGYHREVADLAQLTSGLNIGNGVAISQIQRVISNALDSAVNENTFQSNDLSTQVSNLRQVQSFLDTGTGSLSGLLEQFFNQIGQMTSQPDDTTQRQVLLSTAGALASKFNSLDSSFQKLQESMTGQMQSIVGQINSLGGQIAQLNGSIQLATAQGNDVNDLQDQRDQLISKLAQFADVRTIDGGQGQTNVLVGGLPLVLGNQSQTLQFSVDATGKAQVTAAGVPTPLAVSGGQLAGLMQLYNVALPTYRGQLNALSQTLIQNVDEVQATGIGLTGAMTSLLGQRGVSSATVPLAQAGLALPPQAGSLFITVTNQATGQKTLRQVNIDPATQSLQDVANAISGVANVQAVVNGQSQTLEVLAKPGYTFDFAGDLPSTPVNQNLTGTATAQIGGTYTGSTNDTYTFHVMGTGTIGVTPNLSLQVLNSSGTLIGTANIGQGYSPGTPLAAANGINVTLSAGTVNAGDSFATPVIAQPDSAGILPALGLNTFFSGNSAADIQVNPQLANNPAALAAGQSGQPGDSGNLQRLLALRDQNFMANGTASMGQFYDTMVSGLGGQIQDVTQRQNASQAVGQQLQTEQSSLSGVDPNEELVRLLQFQRAFQLSAKYVDLVNSTMDDLLNVIK